MREADYSTLPREELVRRLALAREWGQKLLEANRALSLRVSTLDERVTMLKERVAHLAHDIERAGEAVSNFLDMLQFADAEDLEPFMLSEQLRDELSDYLPIADAFIEPAASFKGKPT